MIGKYCEYCRSIQPYDHQCKSKPKRTTAVNHNNFYSSNVWAKKRESIKIKCFGLDIYKLVIDGVIEYGDVVHHIVPLCDDYNLRLNDNNLILLSNKSHQEIHKMLDTNYISTIQLLRECLSKFEKLKVGGI